MLNMNRKQEYNESDIYIVKIPFLAKFVFITMMFLGIQILLFLSFFYFAGNKNYLSQVCMVVATVFIIIGFIFSLYFDSYRIVVTNNVFMHVRLLFFNKDINIRFEDIDNIYYDNGNNLILVINKKKFLRVFSSNENFDRFEEDLSYYIENIKN